MLWATLFLLGPLTGGLAMIRWRGASREAADTERGLAACEQGPKGVEKSLSFARGFLGECVKARLRRNLRQKRMVPKAVLPSGLTFDGKNLGAADKSFFSRRSGLRGVSMEISLARDSGSHWSCPRLGCRHN